MKNKKIYRYLYQINCEGLLMLTTFFITYFSKEPILTFLILITSFMIFSYIMIFIMLKNNLDI